MKNQLKGINRIPRLPELNTADIWREVKKSTEFAIYFPDAYVIRDKIPQRDYLFEEF